MLAVRGKDEAGRSVDLTCRNGCARWSALRAAVDENLTTRGTASRARTGYAARVARRMVDMLRSQLPANSCEVAPCARPLGPPSVGPVSGEGDGPCASLGAWRGSYLRRCGCG